LSEKAPSPAKNQFVHISSASICRSYTPTQLSLFALGRDDGQPIAGAPFHAEVIAPMLVDRDSRFEARLEHIDIKRETLKRIGPVHYELEQVSKIGILRKFRKRFGAKTIHDIHFRVG
jgi:hypothetical protein